MLVCSAMACERRPKPALAGISKGSVGTKSEARLKPIRVHPPLVLLFMWEWQDILAVVFNKLVTVRTSVNIYKRKGS